MGWRDRKRFEQRIRVLIPRLYAIATSWGCPRSTCDDLVQETVTTALDKLAQLRDPNAFDVWVIRILVNTHRLYLRQHRWLTTLDEDSLTLEALGPSQHLESARTVDRVRAAISMLSDEHRKVVVLVDMEEMSYREVAEVLDIKIGTVMSRLGRARKKLRAILAIQERQATSTATTIDSDTPQHSSLRSVK